MVELYAVRGADGAGGGLGGNGGAGGWYGWNLWQNRAGMGPSGYTQALYRNLELPEVPARAYLNTSGPIAWTDEQVKLRDVKARKATRPKKKGRATGGGKAAMASDEAPPSWDVDFSGEGADRALTSEEMQIVGRKAESQLRSCANAEAARRGPGQIRIKVWILPNGHLKAAAKGTAALAACAKRAVRGIAVPPFGGAPRSFDVDFAAGNQ